MFGIERRVMESTSYLEPTIIARRDEEGKEGVAYVGGQNALIVFRSKDEAEMFRDFSGLYPASEGFEAIPVDEAEIGRTCDRHDLRRICVPEPWTETSGASFYDAAEFSGMLRESVLDEDG
jgi:hypothetical protein